MVLGMKMEAQPTKRLIALLMLTVLIGMWFSPPAAHAGTLNIFEEDYAGDPGGVFEYIEFHVTRPSLYELKTSFYQQDCDTVLWLFDSGHGIIAENDDYMDLYACVKLRLDAGTYYFSITDLGETGVYCHFEINDLEAVSADKPYASFSFDGENAGRLLGTTAQMEYSLDGGNTWIACTAPSTSLSDAVSSINEDDDIQVKDMGDGVTTIESTLQIIDITQAEVPTADKMDCTTLANNDGKLTGVTTAMEYKLSTAVTWTSGTGSDITGLTTGDYYVRVKATGTVQASDTQDVTIEPYSGTPATTPSAKPRSRQH